MIDQHFESLQSTPLQRAKVSLTMIVRDEEHKLATCLRSVRNLFDEIVVVDTGSVDRTKDIARQYGARIVDFKWIDDFSAARTGSLAHATGDYIFWLDADDILWSKLNNFAAASR